MSDFRNVLEIAPVREKLKALEGMCHGLLSGNHFQVPDAPARDAELRNSRNMPDKLGLQTKPGRARMLHDLGSIELQAMELGLRTLAEFPDAPADFREELAAVTLSEGEHLKLCIDGIEELGGAWAEWPVHIGLWNTTAREDDLIDRVVIVHRYLEGNGLDAGGKLFRRLDGMTDRDASWAAVERIHREEIGHVDFGSRWYRELCRRRGLDPSVDFPERMTRLSKTLPYRGDRLNIEARLKGGFTEDEISVIERLYMRYPRNNEHRRN